MLLRSNTEANKSCFLPRSCWVGCLTSPEFTHTSLEDVDLMVSYQVNVFGIDGQVGICVESPEETEVIICLGYSWAGQEIRVKWLAVAKEQNAGV